MTRRPLHIGAALATAAAALAAASMALARPSAAAPAAIFCGQTGTGPAAALATVGGAAWLREGASAKDRWYALASSSMRCDAVRALVAVVTARATSRGTVAQVAFVVDGWRCTADRDLKVGSCSVLLKGAARYVAVFPQNDYGQVSALTIYRGILDLRDVAPTAEAPAGAGPSTPDPPADAAAYRGQVAQRCTPVAGARWAFPERTPAGWTGTRPFPRGRSGDQWRVWALGGISCLAAQGWVADLSPRVVRDFTGLGGLRTESQWSCVTGGGELPVGLCQRFTEPPRPIRPPGRHHRARGRVRVPPVRDLLVRGGVARDAAVQRGRRGRADAADPLPRPQRPRRHVDGGRRLGNAVGGRIGGRLQLRLPPLRRPRAPRRLRGRDREPPLYLRWGGRPVEVHAERRGAAAVLLPTGRHEVPDHAAALPARARPRARSRQRCSPRSADGVRRSSAPARGAGAARTGCAGRP